MFWFSLEFTVIYFGIASIGVILEGFVLFIMLWSGMALRRELLLLVLLFVACLLFNLTFIYGGFKATFIGMTISENSRTRSECSRRWYGLVATFSLPLLHNLLVALCVDRLYAVFFPISYHNSSKNYHYFLAAGCLVLAAAIAAYVILLAQEETSMNVTLCFLPLQGRSEFGGAIYFSYLLLTTLVAFCLCLPTFFKAYALARDASKLGMEPHISRSIVYVTVTVGLIALSMFLFLVIPDILLLTKFTETSTEKCLYALQELNSIVIVFICVMRMSELRSAILRWLRKCLCLCSVYKSLKAILASIQSPRRRRRKMFEEKLLIGVASLASLVAMTAVLVVVPSLYSTINEIHDRVLDGVQNFRVETDAAWSEIMDVHVKVAPAARPQENPFNSIFREKRGSDKKKRQTGLPSWCQCEVSRPTCPPGPAGSPGAAGAPGAPGAPGDNGADGAPGVATGGDCHHDTACIRCPAGPAGAPGPQGPSGAPGPAGAPGGPGSSGRPGGPGGQGAVGDAGANGAPGSAGSPGAPGRSGTRSVGRPGPAGASGQAGGAGGVGPAGAPGSAGAPGAAGPAGPAGAPGRPGAPGRDGGNGAAGVPGGDAAYCPCPPRSAVFLRA